MEEAQINQIGYYQFGLESLRRVPGIYELYQGYEKDVIWIQSDADITSLLLAIGN